MIQRKKLFIFSLLLILLGTVLISLVYLIYLIRIPEPDTIEVLRWKNIYSVRPKEISSNKLVVTALMGRDKPSITFVVELLPYARIYKYENSVSETNNEVLENE